MAKKSDNWEKVGIILSTVIALVAIVISMRSCSISSKAVGISEESNRISKESNVIAKEALENSKILSLTEQRPYIIIEPKKFKDTDSFLKVSRVQDDKQIRMEVSYNIKNVGLLPAKNISFPKVVVANIHTKDKKSPKVTVYMPTKGITLGHDQSYNVSFGIEGIYQLKKKGIKEIFDEYNSEKFNVTMQIILFYENELEPSKKYKTLGLYKISKNRVIIIKTEME